MGKETKEKIYECAFLAVTLAISACSWACILGFRDITMLPDFDQVIILVLAVIFGWLSWCGIYQICQEQDTQKGDPR